MSDLYDVATEKELMRCTLTRDAQAVVKVYGDVDKAALDRLIELLVLTRNDWDYLTMDVAHERAMPSTSATAP